MCEFCRTWHDEDTICGADIKIYKCASETTLTTAQIIKNANDSKPGVVIFKTMQLLKDILKLIIALFVVESWWNNET